MPTSSPKGLRCGVIWDTMTFWRRAVDTSHFSTTGMTGNHYEPLESYFGFQAIWRETVKPGFSLVNESVSHATNPFRHSSDRNTTNSRMMYEQRNHGVIGDRCCGLNNFKAVVMLTLTSGRRTRRAALECSCRGRVGCKHRRREEGRRRQQHQGHSWLSVAEAGVCVAVFPCASVFVCVYIEREERSIKSFSKHAHVSF